MDLLKYISVLLGAVMMISAASTEDNSVLDCILEENAVACAQQRIGKQLDEMELDVSGKKSETPISKVLEEAGSLISDGINAVVGRGAEDGEEEVTDEGQDESIEVEEARKKKFGKKKKKALQKLIMVAMLIKAKISLLLQIVSTHLQFKFFALALISLLINAARFWIDLKKGHQPAKVIYYEHAQHQHHYDHEDDHGGYWGRSSDPDELAYSAYSEERR